MRIVWPIVVTILCLMVVETISHPVDQRPLLLDQPVNQWLADILHDSQQPLIPESLSRYVCAKPSADILRRQGTSRAVSQSDLSDLLDGVKKLEYAIEKLLGQSPPDAGLSSSKSGSQIDTVTIVPTSSSMPDTLPPPTSMSTTAIPAADPSAVMPSAAISSSTAIASSPSPIKNPDITSAHPTTSNPGFCRMTQSQTSTPSIMATNMVDPHGRDVQSILSLNTSLAMSENNFSAAVKNSKHPTSIQPVASISASIALTMVQNIADTATRCTSGESVQATGSNNIATTASPAISHPTNQVASSSPTGNASKSTQSAQNQAGTAKTLPTSSQSYPLVTLPASSSANSLSSLITPPKPQQTPLSHSSPVAATSSISKINTSATASPNAPTSSAPAGQKGFNAASSSNVAVYYGQTPATTSKSLSDLCADASIDIVILAFVISQGEGNTYPTINFSGACGGQTSVMASKAPGLLSCPNLAKDIQTCQTQNQKKVLLSLGGATSQMSFTSADEASGFADQLWKLFGPPGSIDPGLRPFGEAVVDGFDIDNEDNLPANFGVLGASLRQHFGSDNSKQYFLSSAPQCPFPDASNPLDLLHLCDFIFVQFYNNPPCEIGSAGFKQSLNQWSQAFLNKNSNPSAATSSSTSGTNPKIYLGAPAFSAAGSTAYANIGNPQGMEAIAREVSGLKLPNFGGAMFWDGPEGMENELNGRSILDYAKKGLTEVGS